MEATVEGTVGRTVGGGRIVRGWGVPAWMTCRRWTARQTRPGPVRSRAARALSAQSRLATFRSQLDGDRQGDADSSTRGRLCSKPRAAGAACPIGTGLHARLALCAQIPHWRGAPAPAGFGRIPHPLVSYLPLGSPPIAFSLSERFRGCGGVPRGARSPGRPRRRIRGSARRAPSCWGRSPARRLAGYARRAARARTPRFRGVRVEVLRGGTFMERMHVHGPP